MTFNLLILHILTDNPISAVRRRHMLMPLQKIGFLIIKGRTVSDLSLLLAVTEILDDFHATKEISLRKRVK